nr:hypothetical protein GCM10025730_35960 [Promicromonospora thailandica]
MPSQEANAVGGTLQERVVRTIRNDIEAGRLVDGEALPSTRDLAKQMEVSVFTINEAMKSLASEGLIENRPGSRRIVRSSRPVTPPDRAGRPRTPTSSAGTRVAARASLGASWHA